MHRSKFSYTLKKTVLGLVLFLTNSASVRNRHVWVAIPDGIYMQLHPDLATVPVSWSCTTDMSKTVRYARTNTILQSYRVIDMLPSACQHASTIHDCSVILMVFPNCVMKFASTTTWQRSEKGTPHCRVRSFLRIEFISLYVMAYHSLVNYWAHMLLIGEWPVPFRGMTVQMFRTAIMCGESRNTLLCCWFWRTGWFS